MTSGIKKKFTKESILSNLWLKILSLVAAIIIWLVVINATDPVISKTYTDVPVRILNSNLITDEGKTLEVLDGTDVIASVTIKASRTTIQDLGNTNDNIYATADMSELSADGTLVPIQITTTKYSDKIDTIRSSISNIKVNIEDRKNIQLPIGATTSGDIESGYILGDVTPAQNQVRISGPESIVDTISSASVDVSVTGFTENISTQSEIILYTADGDEVDKKNLELNVDSVRVDVEILSTKRVPIYYAVSGVPADGYEATGEVELEPETVIIAGSADAISSVSSISIPSSELNITGQSADMDMVLKLSDYLPSGVRLADKNSNTLKVTVHIEEVTEKEYEVSLKNLTIDNVPEGFEAEAAASEDTVSFSLRGLAQNLEKVKTSDLNLRVDFDDYVLLNNVTKFREGIYECYLVMDLPEGVEATDTYPILIKLTKTGE